MTPCFFPSSLSREAERVLTQHGQAFPILGASGGAEFVYYTHDLSRNLMYLSESAWEVCRIGAAKWLQKPLHPIFTDDPCNQILIADDSTITPNRTQSLLVEIWNDEGERVKMKVWRRLVLLYNEPIGVVGMAKRFLEPSAQRDLDPGTVSKRIATLTRRERDVIELVIQGELNKSIARKLDIAIRTVEARRAKAMNKLHVRRVADLVRLWIVNERQRA